MFIFCFSSIISVLPQESEKIDEFGGISCGDFTSRVDFLFPKFENSPNSKLYVIYYGGRYRKIREKNEKTNKYDVVKLEYPNRDDGLAYAKSIPVYLTDATFRSIKVQKLFKDRIILIDGGYRENTEFELWFVPKDAKVPEPTPIFAEKDINFTSKNSLHTPNFNCCYNQCSTKGK